MAAAFSSPREVEVEEGEQATTTSLTTIAVGPPPAAAIMIVINGAAVGWTDLSPPMTAVAIIAIVVMTIAVDGVADGGGRRSDRSDSPHDRRCNNCNHGHDDRDQWGGRRSDRSDSPHDVLQKMLELIFQL